jgi:hypothetical protein
LVNFLTNALNEFLFKIILLLPMGAYCQLEKVQNEEPLKEIENRDKGDNRRLLQVTGSLCDKPKQFFFYASCSPWCREQQEKKRIIDISGRTITTIILII